uniref:Transcription initiation factor IIB n=1 Tax=Macrostomum lignano TaxID=282301 RepID=A0A1I8GT66_9PLAT
IEVRAVRTLKHQLNSTGLHVLLHRTGYVRSRIVPLPKNIQQVLAQLDSAMLTARRHSQQQSQNSECNHPDEEVDVDSTLIVELDARTRHQLEEAGHRRLRRSRSVTRSLLTLFLSQVSVAADGTEGPASVHPVTPDEGSEQSGAAESFRVVHKVTCKYHPEAVLIEDYHCGDLVCSQCGLVVGDRVIDVGSEWRTFANDGSNKDMSRVGSAENPLLESTELTTRIANTGRESYGVDPETGRPVYKNKKNLSIGDRTLTSAFKEIDQMANRLNLPKSVVNTANKIFKQVYDSKQCRGRANETIASACLYMACRQEAVPRTLKEVCSVSHSNRRDIGKAFRKITKALDTNLKGISTTDFMSRFCSNLELNIAIQKAATHIAEKAMQIDEVAGKSPISVAAAAIYMACQASDTKKEKKEIGDIAGVAEVTIAGAYKIMRSHAKSLFPPDFVFQSPVESLPWQ